jgi:hypothetical protein
LGKDRGPFEIHCCFKITFDEEGKIKSEQIRGKPTDNLIGMGLRCFCLVSYCPFDKVQAGEAL